MKIFNTILFCFLISAAFCQDLYDMNTIQTIKITFTESNWDQILDNAYATTEDYTMATEVEINGIVFDSVGVKYKGNSTYNSNQTKNPFHIELDTYKDHDYDGYKDIKLSNVAKDPSFLREVLSYQILRQYMVAPQSNYANVYVNDQHIGLYTNSESITKTFTKKYFDSKNNTFIKCNPPAGAGPQSNDLPSLEFLGQDSTAYYYAYEIKSEGGWAELIELTETLNTNLVDIESILDVDKTLWMHAYNNALVNLDSYSGMFTQNYYLYRNDHGQFMPIVWDLNESFGRFSGTGSGNLNSTAAKQEMDHLLHTDDPGFPLIQRILALPIYRRMYLAHYKTIMLENFDNESYYSTATALKDLIDQAVQNDANNLFDYNDFLENLDSDIGGGGPGGPGGGGPGGATPGIAPLMDGRNDYILGLSDFNQTEPSIDNITLSNLNPIVGESVFVQTEVSDAVSVFLGYRNDPYAPFTKVLMQDDGASGDNQAGDGIYGVEISIDETFTQYFIYADNNNAGKFSPVRAEHEFHTIIANSISQPAGDLVINEFQASNTTTQIDQDDEYDDWIELYNNTDTDISLDGYFLTDDKEEFNQWAFPTDATIPANDYLIIWADKDEEQEGLHANFKLSSEGESIFLIDADNNVVDEVNYLAQDTDHSYGRFPNGTGDFFQMMPTFNNENMLITDTKETEELTTTFKVFPNPSNDHVSIELNQLGNKNIVIYNATGMQMTKEIINDVLSIDISEWSTGIYFIRIDDQFTKLVVE